VAFVAQRDGAVLLSPGKSGSAGFCPSGAVAVTVVAGAVRGRTWDFGGAVGVVGVFGQTDERKIDPVVGVVQGGGVAAAGVADAAVKAGYTASGVLGVTAGCIGLSEMAAVAVGRTAPGRSGKYCRGADTVVVWRDDITVAVQVAAGTVRAGCGRCQGTGRAAVGSPITGSRGYRGQIPLHIAVDMGRTGGIVAETVALAAGNGVAEARFIAGMFVVTAGGGRGVAAVGMAGAAANLVDAGPGRFGVVTAVAFPTVARDVAVHDSGGCLRNRGAAGPLPGVVTAGGQGSDGSGRYVARKGREIWPRVF